MCEYSIVLPYGSLYVISFVIIAGDIVVVAFFNRYIFSPESAISSILLQVVLGGLTIQFIKIILGLLISILLIITPNRNLHPFFAFA